MSGLAANVAVARLLGLLGHSCAPDELPLLREGTVSGDDIREELSARGIIARLVTTTPADLLGIRLPTLAQLRDGGWLVLRKRERHGFSVDRGGSTELLPHKSLAELLSGVALDITPTLGLGGGLWRAMVPAVLKDTKALAAIITASLLVQLCSLLPPQLTRAALDHALPLGAGSLLNAITLGLLFAGAFQAWTSWLRQRAVQFLNVHLQLVVERGFLDHLLRLPFPLLRGRTIGECMQAMSGIGEARRQLTERTIGVFLDGSMAAAYLVVMAASMPRPTALIALAAILIALVTGFLGHRQAQLQRAEVESYMSQRSLLWEAISGIATVKSMGAEGTVLRRWVQVLLGQFSASVGRQRVGLWAEIAIDGMRQGFTVLLIVWGGYLTLHGEVTLGTFIAFIQMSAGFLGGVLGLSSTAVSLMVLGPQLAQTKELARISSPAARRAVSGARAREVTMEDVWFRYAPESPWVLSGHHLQVEAGDKCWIKGPSGWGKTTMLRLLAGLYPPERGTVRIGGHDPARTRGVALFLPQFVHLYSGSIYDNLRVLSGYVPRTRLLEAAEASGLADFVRGLAMGYDTSLPPGGFNLSGGQRQLIAVTAAMASYRQVLLMDEAFLHLDGLSRSWLVKSPWFEGRTVVYVSHDTHFGLG